MDSKSCPVWARRTAIHPLAQRCHHVILHYVNYGYQARGVPFYLRRFARQLRGQLRGRWLTTFHEIYASGPPWKSEFWLRPFQVKIARDLIDLSDACFVSNVTIETGDPSSRCPEGGPSGARDVEFWRTGADRFQRGLAETLGDLRWHCLDCAFLAFVRTNAPIDPARFLPRPP